MLDVVRQYRNTHPKTIDCTSEFVTLDVMDWIDEYCIKAHKAEREYIEIPRDKLCQFIQELDVLLKELNENDEMEEKTRQEKIDIFSGLQAYLWSFFT